MTWIADSTSTVYVVDDDASVRKSLERLLKSAGYRSKTFPSADVFLERYRQDPLPGCLLLDLLMPGLDGLQLQHELKTLSNPLPIIFITGHGDIPSTVTAMKAGASDFFTKPFNDSALLKAIGEAVRQDQRERAQRDHRNRIAKHYATLTPREREVMALVVRGLLNKQIADVLGASEKTIKIHRGRVMQKMKVRSVADLVRAAEKIAL